MTRIIPTLFILFSFVFWANGLIFADHECTRTVACSDGTELITTDCTSSYSIIDGHIVDDGSDNADDPGHHHHHGDENYDPCSLGHGHRIDNGPDDFVGNGSGNSDDVGSDDPYGLRHGRHHDYDPDDPYGLRQRLHQTTNAE